MKTGLLEWRLQGSGILLRTIYLTISLNWMKLKMRKLNSSKRRRCYNEHDEISYYHRQIETKFLCFYSIIREFENFANFYRNSILNIVTMEMVVVTGEK